MSFDSAHNAAFPSLAWAADMTESPAGPSSSHPPIAGETSSIGATASSPGNPSPPTHGTPPFAPSYLAKSKSTPDLKDKPKFQRPRKPSLRKMISQPIFMPSTYISRQKISKELKIIRDGMENSVLGFDVYSQMLRDRARDLLKIQQSETNHETRGGLVSDSVVRDACFAVCYNALHREDESIVQAVGILKKMEGMLRAELERWVKSVLENHGGSAVDLITADRWKDLMRNVLGVLGIDWSGRCEGGLLAQKPPWTTEQRKWEMRKFCGIIWYALKIFHGQIDWSAETILDYAVRASSRTNQIPKDITILSPYFAEQRKVRSLVRKYLNQMFEPSNWEQISPLLWIVHPSNAIPIRVSRDASSSSEDGYPNAGSTDVNIKNIDPAVLGYLYTSPFELPPPQKQKKGDIQKDVKIVLVQVGPSQFAIYRVFESAEDDDYHDFLWSVHRMGGTKPSRIAKGDLFEFFRCSDAWGDEKQRSVKEKVDRLARIVGNGRLTGEVRFMYACLEVGIEMAYTTRQGAWLGVSESVDGLPDRKAGVFRTDTEISEDDLGEIVVPEAADSESHWPLGRSSEELRRQQLNKQVSDGVWSYFGFRVFDVKYEEDLQSLKFMDTALEAVNKPRWFDFGLPKDWQKGHILLPWEEKYREVQSAEVGTEIPQDDYEKLGTMITPMWKQVLLRKVERDRGVLVNTLWGQRFAGKKLKGLKARDGRWYGSWKCSRESTYKGLKVWKKKERKEAGKRERLRIKEVEVLGFEGKRDWDKASKEGWFRRVFEGR
ncbi:hypothetical protein TWF718_007549 [Orbilia javanica]|uniref:Uncharacterized protein n=1 Tax=Orbilia javanica TaxID=47235 RepID=A0AAN8RII4_9PEZI